MPLVDKRIVEMVFKNQDFERKAQKSMDTIDKLKKSTEFDRSSAGIDAIASSVQKLEARFSNVGIVGKRVLENLTDTAMHMTGKITSFLTSGVVSGGISRAMNLEQSRFMMQNLFKDEEKVKAAMDDVNKSVDGTAYSLDQAALVATQFTAAGVSTGQELEEALKGLAGAAATFNTDYASLGNVFTDVASSGRVMGDTLLQLSTRGIPATQVFADFFNAISSGDESVKDVPDDIKKMVTSALKQSKKVSDVAHVTAGEVKDMASEGLINFQMFSQAMFTTFGENAAKANETFTGAMSNIKSALGRIGAGFVEPLIVQNGPLVNMLNAIREKTNEVKAGLVFNKEVGNTEALSKRVTDFVIDRIDALTKKLGSLDIEKLLTAFYNVVDGLVNIGKVIKTVITPIGEAFREIFPKKTTDDLVAFTERFKAFTEKLSVTENTIKTIKDIFKGLFSLLDAGKTIIAGFINTFGPIFIEVAKRVISFIGDVAGAFGRFFQDIRSFVNAISESLKFPTDELTGLPEKIADEFKDSPAFRTVLGILTTFRDGIQKILDSFRGIRRDGVTDAVDGVERDFSVLDTILSGLTKFADTLKKVFTKIGQILAPVVSWVHDIFHNALDEFKLIISKIDTKHTTSVVLNGGLAYILTQIGNAIKNIGRGFSSGGGIGHSISEMLTQIGNAMKTVKAYMNAKTLKLIADAILELVAAIVLLAIIPTEDVTRGLMSIFAIIGMLELITKSVEKLSSGLIDSGSMALIGFTMMELSAAILIAVASIVVLAFIGYDNIVKGLFAISMICLMMTKTLKSVTKTVTDSSWKGIIGASALIASAAVAIMTIVASITVLAILTKFVGPGVIFTAIGAVASIALVLGLTIKGITSVMDDVSVGTLAKTVIAVTAITASLVTISTVVSVLAILLGVIPTEILTRGLLTLGAVVLATMTLCAILVQGFGGQSMLEAIKAAGNFVLLAGTLVLVGTAIAAISSIIGLIPFDILAVGLGGLALIIAALMIFYVEITKIGARMKLSSLLKSIIKLTLVIGVTTALFGGLLLMALSIGAVIKVLGSINILEVSGFIMSILGVILVGALLSTKIPRFSKGLDVMANVLVKLSKAFVLFSTGAKLLISAMIKLKNLTDDEVKAINKNLVGMFEGIKNAMPVVVETIFVILSSIVKELMSFILENVPLIVSQALDAFIISLHEIVDRIPEILTMVYEVFYNVVEALRPMLDDIVNEIILLLIDLINALAKAIDKNSKPILDAVDHLIDSIVKLVVEALGRLFGQNHKDISKWLDKHKTTLRNFVKWFGLALAGLKIIGIMKKLGGILKTLKEIIKKAKSIEIGTSSIKAAGNAIEQGPLAKVKALNSYFGGHGILVGSISAFAIAGALALKHYVDAMDVVDQQTKDMEKEAELAKEAYEEAYEKATEGANEFRKALSKNVSAEDEEWQQLSLLKGKLGELVDSHGKVKEGSEELASTIVTKLNDALGTNYDIVDGQIAENGKLKDSYKEVSDAIDEMVAKQRASDILDSTKSDYAEAKKFLNDTTNTTRYNELKYGTAIQDAKDKLDKLNKYRTSLFAKEDIDNFWAVDNDYGLLEIMSVGEFLDNTEESVKTLREALKYAGADLSTIDKEIKDTGLDADDSMMDFLRLRGDSKLVSSITSAYDSITNEIETTTDAYKSMEGELKGLEESFESYGNIVTQVDELQKAYAAGDTERMNQKVQEIEWGLQTATATNAEELAKQAQDNYKAYQADLNMYKHKEAGKTAAYMYQSALRQKASLEELKRKGVSFPGLSLQISQWNLIAMAWKKKAEEETIELTPSVDVDTDDAEAKAKEGGSDVADDVADAFDLGIVSNIPGTKSTMTEYAQSAIGAAKGKGGFDSHSPSKVFIGIGKSVVEGFVKGVNDDTGLAIAAMSKMATLTIAATNAALANQGKVSVKPIVDLSAIQNGSIQGMLNGRSLALNSNVSSQIAASINSTQFEAQMDKLSDQLRAMHSDMITIGNNNTAGLNNLGRTINGMQVVMNTGALVGQIAAPIDSAIGGIAAIKKRG